MLTGLSANRIVTVVAAAGVGLFAMWLNAKLVSLVRGSDVGSELTVEMLEGRAAEVVVPFAAGSKGKISLDLDGQRLYLVATGYRDRDFAAGDHVVVVKLDKGAAYVASLDELD
jgi:membrane protein implicated in regulation of membrane protease activity